MAPTTSRQTVTATMLEHYSTKAVAMSVSVMLLVLLAAALHASWNYSVKKNADPDQSMTAVVIGHSPIALIIFAFAPFPAAMSWPWIVVGAILHVLYQWFLMSAYRLGDLSNVYPLARGSAPLIITLVSILFLDQRFLPLELLAIAIIILGILSQTQFTQGKKQLQAAGLSLITGLIIASYSLVDGHGARLAETALGFYAALALINTGLLVLLMWWRRPGLVTRVWKQNQQLAITGGTASFAAYALVIWAFTQAPIALVSALRETSILFAVVLGMVLLKEKPTPRKLVSVVLMVLGLVLLRLAPLVG